MGIPINNIFLQDWLQKTQDTHHNQQPDSLQPECNWKLCNWCFQIFQEERGLQNNQQLHHWYWQSWAKTWFLNLNYCCSLLGYYQSQENLAKLGCRPDTQVQKFKNPFIFWLPTGTWWRFLAIHLFFLIRRIRPFFITKILCICQK